MGSVAWTCNLVLKMKKSAQRIASYHPPRLPIRTTSTSNDAPSITRYELYHMGAESPLPTIRRELEGTSKDAFFAVDLENIVKKHILWKRELPRIQPYYAVKCNADQGVLATLGSMGLGFDCASKVEIAEVLNLGVESNRIIYANTCKQNSHLEYAARNNISCMTFDNERELLKIKHVHPTAELLLRLEYANSESVSLFPLSKKFGCRLEDVCGLSRLAKQLQMNVFGISFHIGNGCIDPRGYTDAIETARKAFDIAAGEGLHFDVLDIGGGFLAQEGTLVSFTDMASEIRAALNEYFPATCGVRVIAEPGTFYVATAFTLVANVIGKRWITPDVTAEDEPTVVYYINDGKIGSINFNDYAPQLQFCCTDTGELLDDYHNKRQHHWSTVWGPTCDSQDIVQDKVLLPELDIGDWICYRNMGAYTSAYATSFNGMGHSRCVYYGHMECQGMGL